jgi:starch synthase
MRVLHVASEVFPLAKTGGLADVSAALPAALNELGIDARLVLPGYPLAIERAAHPQEVARFDGLLGCDDVRLLAARLPDSGIRVWLVDCPSLYGRNGGLYQNEDGRDWHDNALRFALLNHVAAHIADGSADERWQADIVHAHDWHAGLVPLLLAARAGQRPASVLTIHNLAYQGLFAAEELGRLALPNGSAVRSSLEFYGSLSFLKAGISWADALTTVSPTYAREILTPDYGCGLDGLLRERSARLSGIMNGADYRVWDPGNDVHLPATYTAHKIAGKRDCKAAIQNEMALTPSPETPLLAFASRLAHQKMPDVVLDALPALLAEGIQLALVADGDAGYANRFRDLAACFPGQVSVQIGYEEGLGHRLLAGADMLLHPSRYEPCGLSPIYAMRCGTLPIVRRSGGLADSVVDADQNNIKEGIATGFSFSQPTAHDLIACVQRAVSVYRQPIVWRKIRSHAMRQEFGWGRPAQAYADLYRRLVAAPAETEIEQEIECAKLSA